jgi:hypothetical protein
MPVPHSTRRRDSASAALLVEQWGNTPPMFALLAQQRGIQVHSSPSIQGLEARYSQPLKSHRHRRITLPLPGWEQLSRDFSPIGDQDAPPAARGEGIRSASS